MKLEVSNVPTHVITGFLGTGKTTAILSAFRHRPDGERWAVLVNEFGEIGLDGVLLTEGGLAVKEIPGGCICCTAGVALRFGLIELLRTQRPHRLFIEPTGLADPAGILDLLRQPGIRDAIAPRATIGLVDPRHLGDARYEEHDIWQAQLAMADVLVGTFASQRTSLELATFGERAEALWPSKLVIAVSDGETDPAWLEIDPYPRELAPLHHPTERTAGWVFPRDQVFDADALVDAVQALVRPNPAVPEGLLRLKGIFRTPGRWLLVQGTPQQVRTSPVRWRRDSRVECIAGGELDGPAVLERLLVGSLERP